MIVYVDMEHDRLRQDRAAWEKSRVRCLKHKERLEEISGLPCLIVPYTRLSLALLGEVQAQAVVVSGCFTDYKHYDTASLAPLYDLYRKSVRPVLGLCAGFQLMARVFGAEIGPMGSVPPGATEMMLPINRPDLTSELGFQPVQVVTPHPLFAGLTNPVFFQAHYWEVKALPAGFQNLARSERCELQAIVHTARPLCGVQFHAEEYDETHLDGRRLLENFFLYYGVRPGVIEIGRLGD